MNTKSTEASSREQLRIAEKEGKLPPGRHRKRPAETQNASLIENTLSTGHPDAQKVSPSTEDGHSDPTARGCDAPVDVR